MPQLNFSVENSAHDTLHFFTGKGKISVFSAYTFANEQRKAAFVHFLRRLLVFVEETLHASGTGKGKYDTFPPHKTQPIKVSIDRNVVLGEKFQQLV